MAFSLYDSWHRAHILRDQVSTEGLKNMINFKKGSGEKDSPSSVNSSSPTGQPGGTSGSVQQPTGELSLSAFIGSPKDPSGLSNSQKSVPIVYSEDNSNETKKVRNIWKIFSLIPS